MKKEARVISVHEDGTAELRVKRDRACGDCASCGGCGDACISLSVKNTLNARAGDTVTVETPTAAVIATAALIYLLPLLLFFAGYAIGTLCLISPALLGGIAFGCALLLVILFGRKIGEKLSYQMCEFVEVES